jgi:hypothetical protein
VSLTLSQLQTLKADIAADPTLNTIPNNGDGNDAIAKAYAVVPSPDFFVWATDVPVQTIYDSIVWANLTPSDAPDGTQLWMNRALACQGKQFNVQILLQGQTRINGAKVNVRAGLQDALSNIPSGAAGAQVSAGWVPVRTALARKANRLEKLFANVSGGNGSTAATAATMVVEGFISYSDIEQARNS